MNPPNSPHTMVPERILIRSVNWVGDVVMSLPALQRIREAYPAAEIILLTPEKLAGLWDLVPGIDDRLVLAPNEGPFRVAARLRPRKIDLALVLPNSPRSALEVWLAGIPRRVGYARPWRNLFLTHVVEDRPGQVRMRKRSFREVRRLVRLRAGPATAPGAEAHQVHDFLYLAGYLGASAEAMAPCLAITEADLEKARALLRGSGPADTVWFGLNPGAEYGPAKRWPARDFAATAIELHRRTGCGWIILGGMADRDLATQLVALLNEASVLPVADLAGQTSLRELCAMLKLCRVVLTNDTGPMHLAVAVGTPVVVPFGSTSPELTGPRFADAIPHQIVRHQVACSPCFLRRCPIDFRCMRTITVGEMTEAALRAAGVIPVVPPPLPLVQPELSLERPEPPESAR